MTIEISDHYGAHIDGEQYEGNDSFTVSDPAIDEPIAAVTETGPEEGRRRDGSGRRGAG